MKPQDAKPQEANLRLTDKCEEQTRGQWDSEAEFLLGEELRQSPCGEKDPDVQGSTESKDQCGGIWAEKNRDGEPFGWSIMGHAKTILLSPERRGEPLKG